MKALIDADSVVYACGFASQKIGYILSDSEGVVGEYKTLSEAKANMAHDDMYIQSFDYDIEPLGNCLHMVKLKLMKMLENCNANDWRVYLSGDGNFRQSLATLQKYKGNRDNVGKPYHFHNIRDYLIRNWDAHVSVGIEADDAIAIDHSKLLHQSIDDMELNSNSIICTIDKDLDTIPGWHYNWKKERKYFVAYFESRRNFYHQVLMGDYADNVPGINGIGEKRAEKLLKDAKTEEEMKEICLSAYKQHYPEGLSYSHWETGCQLVRTYEDIFNENAQLIKLLTG